MTEEVVLTPAGKFVGECLLLLLLSSNLFAEIPASQWVGNWRHGKDYIILNQDTTCAINYQKTKIAGRYGIDWIEGNFVVIDDNGRAYIFKAMLGNDSHDGAMDANILYFYGYLWDNFYMEKYNKKSMQPVVFRKDK